MQIVIIPCGITANLDELIKQRLFDYCSKLNNELLKNNIRSVLDLRDHVSPGWKFNHWELKGVPIRIEIGPKELENSKFVICRRDTLEKITYDDSANVINVVVSMLDNIQQCLLNKARQNLNENIVIVDNWTDFTKELEKGKVYKYKTLKLLVIIDSILL